MAIIRHHRVVHILVRSLAVLLVAALFKGPVESDPSQPAGGAVRLTRGGPQRLESTDVVAHLGDDSAPVVAAIGNVVEQPALDAAAGPDHAPPAAVPDAPAVPASEAASIGFPPVAYPALAPPGLRSRGRAPPSA